MELKLDAQQASAGAAIDRRHAEARQGRWMLELERAAMQMPEPKQERPAQRPDDLLRQRFTPELPHLEPSIQAGDDKSEAQPIFADAQAGQRLASEMVVTLAKPDAAIAPPGSSSMPVSESNDIAADGPAPKSPAAPSGRARHPAAQGLALQHHLAVDGFKFEPEAQTGVATAFAARIHVEGEVQTTPAKTIQQRSRSSTPEGNPTADSLARELDDLPGFAEEAPAAAALPDETLADTDAYAQTHMHMRETAEGVQAWLRDAQINPVQAQLVARALAAELARDGKSLSEMTINGRRTSAGQHTLEQHSYQRAEQAANNGEAQQ